jgi:hypothetical protein
MRSVYLIPSAIFWKGCTYFVIGEGVVIDVQIFDVGDTMGRVCYAIDRDFGSWICCVDEGGNFFDGIECSSDITAMRYGHKSCFFR